MGPADITKAFEDFSGRCTSVAQQTTNKCRSRDRYDALLGLLARAHDMRGLDLVRDPIGESQSKSHQGRSWMVRRRRLKDRGTGNVKNSDTMYLAVEIDHTETRRVVHPGGAHVVVRALISTVQPRLAIGESSVVAIGRTKPQRLAELRLQRACHISHILNQQAVSSFRLLLPPGRPLISIDKDFSSTSRRNAQALLSAQEEALEHGFNVNDHPSKA